MGVMRYFRRSLGEYFFGAGLIRESRRFTEQEIEFYRNLEEQVDSLYFDGEKIYRTGLKDELEKLSKSSSANHRGFKNKIILDRWLPNLLSAGIIAYSFMSKNFAYMSGLAASEYVRLWLSNREERGFHSEIVRRKSKQAELSRIVKQSGGSLDDVTSEDVIKGAREIIEDGEGSSY